MIIDSFVRSYSRMKLPQLVQETIDYYRWKYKIMICNEELKRIFIPLNNGGVITRIGRFFIYGDKQINYLYTGHIYKEHPLVHPEYIYTRNFRSGNPTCTGILPSRYIYSNTEEQLKSLFLSSDY